MDKAADSAQSTRTSKRDRHKDNPNEPAVIGNYRIDRTLGQGTYGKVKLGMHSTTNEKVAIKIIDKANIQSQRQVARIQREIRFLKLLHHPHIVKVYEVHETNDQIFIIMEHVKGGELFDYIVSHKRVKEKEARAFYRQVLSALHYCHANAVIHRDLKPENLLLDDDRGQKTIKIIDFGFGNTFKPQGLLDTFCGSPFYAAPEMILGKRYEGPEVDMWSIGVILFALLCGHLPFDDENIKELYRKIASGSFTCPSYLTPHAKHLIQRLITVDPKKRATLDEVLNHPWVNEGYTAAPYSYLPERPVIRDPMTLSTDIVSRLQAFGYSREDIVKAFAEDDHSKPHPIRSTYFLLSEMLVREEKRAQQAKRAAASAAQSTSQGSSPTAAATSTPASSPAAAPMQHPAVAAAAAVGSATPSSPRLAPNLAHSQASTPASTAMGTPAQAPLPLPIITTISDSQSTVIGVSDGSQGAGDGTQQPLPGSVGGLAPQSPNAVTVSLYSISEDEASEGPTRVAGSVGAPITASKKGTFVSMPQVATDGGKRRSSTTEAENARAAASTPTEYHQLHGHTSRPRHSTNSLQTTASPSSSSTTARTAPAPIRTDIPAGDHNQGHHAAPISAAPVATAHSATQQGSDAKGRRFSLVSLTSGSKRRSSTTPPQQATAPAGSTSPVLSPPAQGDGASIGGSDSGSAMTNGASGSHAGSLNATVAGSADPAVSSAGSDSSVRAVNSWFLSVETTSAKPPMEIVAEVKRVLGENRVVYSHEAGYVIECKTADLVFEIEICKVPRLALYGLHFKRISGGLWAYKKVCNKLLGQMNL